ncbi:MAG TPA: hypothetical protein VI318_09380 [Baekduia sp.]
MDVRQPRARGDAGGVWLLAGGTSKVVAEIVAIPVASVVSFALCRRWVFAA